MGKFREMMEMPAWDDKRPLADKIKVIRQNPAYDYADDGQLEYLLNYLVAEDIAKTNPDLAFEKANDLSFGVGMGMADPDWE